MTFQSLTHLDAMVSSAGYQRCRADWSLNATRTREWPDLDLWLLASGNGYVDAPEGRVRIEPGSCLLMKGGLDYDFVRTSRTPFVHYWAHFDFVDPVTKATLPHMEMNLPAFHRHVGQGTLVYGLFDRVCWESKKAGKKRSLLADRWFGALLLELASEEKTRGTAKGGANSHRGIAAFCDRVRADPAAAYSVEQTARDMGYDSSYFCRLFTRTVGVAPRQFITGTRMELARSLLRESAMSIGCIAESLGYHDVHFFSRHFRAFNGQTPSEYRGGTST